MDNKDPENRTYFGFEEINKHNKSKKVRQVFDEVSDSYNLMNDLMSFGIHRIWKRVAIEMANIRSDSCILDLASGTGDMVKLIAPKLEGKGEVILSDININMLNTGRDRLIDEGINNFKTVQIDAQLLPFKKNTFDIVSMAFGLRNVTDIKQTLKSIIGCLKPGGKLIVLEFSRPTNETVREVYDLYSFEVIPKLGKIVAHSEESYRYLAESIRMHPNQMELKELFKEEGYVDCSYENLTNGIVAIHTGRKPLKK